jgi:hypothetical protein
MNTEQNGSSSRYLASLQVIVRSTLPHGDEHTDLAFLLRCIPPYAEGSPASSDYAYTILGLGHGPPRECQCVIESKAIARVLEKRFPEPPLHLDSPLLAPIAAQVPKVRIPLIPLLVNSRPARLLNPPFKKYYESRPGYLFSYHLPPTSAFFSYMTSSRFLSPEGIGLYFECETCQHQSRSPTQMKPSSIDVLLPLYFSLAR